MKAIALSLLLTPACFGAVYIQWRMPDKTVPLSGFRVEVKHQSGSNWVAFARPGPTNIEALVPFTMATGVVYLFRVFAVSDLGVESNPSDVVSWTNGTPPKPSSPVVLMISK